ncbi:P-loop containing nucleoside triphosphate hydrolase protein, partial [Ochromonadaceae sp. CCMP2298]
MLSRSLRGIKSCRSLRGLRGGAGCIGGRARHSFLSEQDFLSDQAKNAVFVSVGRPTKIPGAPEVTGVAEVTGVTGLELSPASLEPPPFQHLRLGVQLAKYGVNLTKLAAEGQLEKVIGRDEELQQTIQILSRRRKNNPCLVGEAGVGKTSVAEGLAQMIYDGEVPESMAGKSVISLDLPSMLAGTKFRGEFEDRMKGVMKEIEMAGDKIILFIDEIHTMVGAGGSEGAIDASNILKPSLARGKLRCLGATTSDEYAKYIEKDPALARRFQSVYVPEPSAEHTVQILGGIRDKYETHHRVLIPPEAVESAVYLSGRYITSRRYPDKAIDLIDEAASRVRNRRERKPAALERLEKSLHDKLGEMDLAQAQAEAQAQKATGTKAPDTRPPAVGGGIDVDSGEAVDVTEVARLSAQRDALTAAWREKNKLVGLIFVAREERAQCVEQIKGLRRQLLPDKDSFLQNRVAQKENELRQYCVRLQQLAEDERRTAQIGTSDSGSSSGMGGGVSSSGAGAGTVAGAGADEDVEVAVRDALRSVGCEVGGEELAAIVAQSTGIPVSTMLGESEKKKLLGMEAELGRTLVGQAEAITAIARCIRLSRAGLRFHDRPLGVFLMIGPTGVGKTELAKALAELLFQDPQSSLLRIDMSEYMERFSVSRLIGAPPGYVGYEEGGVLTESVRRRPYQVILLDEFEKAHREVSNLLLQVFDEGRLTDSHGNVVDFRNTVIMMTSNLGSDVLGAMKEDPEEGEAGAGT